LNKRSVILDAWVAVAQIAGTNIDANHMENSFPRACCTHNWKKRIRVMSNRSSIHSYLDWAKERLDEIDATLASFEDNAAKLQADASAKAQKAMADMRAARDDFRKSIKENGQESEAVIATSKKTLESQWTSFEEGVLAYLEATGQKAKEQEAAFRACAEAQRKAWHDTIDRLHKSGKNLVDKQRNEIETAVKNLKSESEAAKTRLDKLNKTGGESWAAMKAALAETRAALDKANQAVHDSLKRVA
jgi:hypothetical protein